VLSLRAQVLNLRDQVLDLRDQVLNLRDQVLSLRDQVLDLCDQVLNLRDQVLNFRDRTGPDRTGLLKTSKRKGQASRDQQSGSGARSAPGGFFLTLISGNVLESIGNAKGMVSIPSGESIERGSAGAASQNAV
jgi:hypothetical protein